MEGDVYRLPVNVKHNQISIHALRVEGDYIDTEKCYQILYISIHALRVEGDRKEGSPMKTK